MEFSRPGGKPLTAQILFILILLAGWWLSIGSTPVASAANNKAVARLSWTAPGDDLYWGKATQYDVRYSFSPITEQNWHSAIQANYEPIPKLAGTAELFIISGLEMGATYYFAIKTRDDAFNWSGLSNIVQVTVTSTYLCGDVTGDGKIAVSDAVLIINYIFLCSDPPKPWISGDVTCNSSVDISDAIYIINYVFMGGQYPCDLNDDGNPDC